MQLARSTKEESEVQASLAESKNPTEAALSRLGERISAEPGVTG